MNQGRAVESGRILIVDDQPENLDLLEEILAVAGYTVIRAGSGAQALDMARIQEPDCIVLDIMMPGMDGYQVCRTLKTDERTWYLPIIMLTTLSEVSDRVKGLEVGADDFLAKPVHSFELLARVRSLVRIRRLRQELDSSENIIFSLVNALEMKDRQNAGHSERVLSHSVRLAAALGLAPAELEDIAKAAILHDLGKIGLPEKSLSPGVSSSEALDPVYRRHPEIGAQILGPLASFAGARHIIRGHHERLDGSGYPDGLAGRAFELPVEIVALANAYENLLVETGNREKACGALRRDVEAGRFREETVSVFFQEVIGPGQAVSGSALPYRHILPAAGLHLKGNILVADDLAANRAIMQDILEQDGHRVTMASNGDEVLQELQRNRPDLILLDIRMPEMDGFEICRRIKARPETEFLPVILVTAHRDAMDRLRGTQAGADDFLLLPVNHHELKARVKSLLRLGYYVHDLEQHPNVVLSLASALEAKDPYTHGHSERVAALAVQLAEALGLPEDFCVVLQMAGKAHDIGKIGVPDRLLHKPGRLTEEEFSIIRNHPAQGEQICSHLRSLRDVLPIIRHHHERFNGKGYPDGLTGEDIPLGARIMGLADAYESMTSHRTYRRALESREVLGILRRETEEGLWDPAIFPVFERLIGGRAGA
ncbi:MAG: response regulator [Acidobacteriota bacterium]